MVDLQVPVTGRRGDRPADPADPETEVERVGDAERGDPIVPPAGAGELAERGRARDRDAVAGSTGAGAEAVGLRAGLEPGRAGELDGLGEGLTAGGDDADPGRSRGLGRRGGGEHQQAGAEQRPRPRMGDARGDYGCWHGATLSSRVYDGSAGVRSPGSRDLMPRLPGSSSGPVAGGRAAGWHPHPVTVAGPRRLCTGLPWTTDRICRRTLPGRPPAGRPPR